MGADARWPAGTGLGHAGAMSGPVNRMFPILLAASFMLAASGCTQGQGGVSSQTRDFSEPTHAQFARAIRDGDEGLARELLAAGANPNATDEAGTPLLQWAMREGDRGAVTRLLALGADPSRPDARGRTAMHEAAMAPHADWIDELLGHGVPVDIPNARNGQTPLFEALRAREPGNIDRLLDAGARLDVGDRSGTTPLHQAAMVNDLASVRRFLEAGADPSVRDARGADLASYLYDGDPDMLTARARRDLEWIRARLSDGAGPAPQ